MKGSGISSVQRDLKTERSRVFQGADAAIVIARVESVGLPTKRRSKREKGERTYLTAHANTPVVTQTSVVSNLLQTLEIVAQLGVQLVGHQLRELPILEVVLSVQEPVRDAELSRVAHDHHQRFELGGAELTRALTEIDLSLFAHKVGKSAADPLNLGERVHHLLATINVGVEDADDVLEVIPDDERHRVRTFARSHARRKETEARTRTRSFQSPKSKSASLTSTCPIVPRTAYN